MSDKIKAADAINRLAQSYQAVIDAAALLREIGSLDQAKDEAVKAREVADKEAAEAKAEAKKAKDVVKKAKDDADQIIDGAVIEAKEILANADLDVERKIEDAKLRGESIISAARVMADRVTGDIATEAKRTEDRLKELQFNCSTIEASIADKLKMCDDIEARLAKAQAQVAKLLG